MAVSILNRKRDLCYLAFFVIHIPIMLGMQVFFLYSIDELIYAIDYVLDLTPFYPQSVHTQFPFLLALRKWYTSTYKDHFFTHPPAWFTFYGCMEALYHIPASLWAILGLLNDDPRTPLMLLVFALQTGITTATCIAEFLSWKGITTAEKQALAGLYVPYLVLALLMFVDMYQRLSAKLVVKSAAKDKRI